MASTARVRKESPVKLTEPRSMGWQLEEEGSTGEPGAEE